MNKPKRKIRSGIQAKKALRSGKLIPQERDTDLNTSFTGKMKINSRPFYQHHSHIRNGSVKVVTNYEWKIIVSSIFEKVSNAIVENDSGIFLPGLGYFGVVKFPNKSRKKNVFSGTRLTPFHKRFNIEFFPIRKDQVYRCWSMSNAFTETIVDKLENKIKEGKDYKLNFNLYKSFFGRKRING